MILAIGLVVDDAIVVVERVSYLMTEEKMSSLEASIQAMKDIGSSVIATTLVLLSIFVPVAMMVGITGKIYQQFAITISTAVVFSSVNALTLSPALCAILLKGYQEKETPCFAFFNRGLVWAQEYYLKSVHFLMQHLCVTKWLCLGVILFLMGLFYHIPMSFIPEEDQGFILANVQLPDTATIQQTENVLKEMATVAVQVAGVEYLIGIAGTSMLSASGENIGMAAIGLRPWKERTKKNVSLNAITRRLSSHFQNYSAAQIEFFAMPAIPGVGSSGGLTFQLNALNAETTPEELYKIQEKMLTLMNQDKLFKYAFGTFTAQTPHIYLDIDRVKLESYGIAVASLFQVLQNNLGSRYVNNISSDGQTHKVIVAADLPYRQTQKDIGALFVHNKEGIPIQIQDFIA